MSNQKLLSYIKKQLQSGIDKETIRNTLIAKGWGEKDVSESMSSIEKTPPVTNIGFLNKLPRRRIFYLAGGAILIVVICLASWLILSKQVERRPVPKIDTEMISKDKSKLEEGEIQEIYKEISSRKNIDDQKNINTGEEFSSGFLDINALIAKKKASISHILNFINKVFAVENSTQYPFLFYIQDKIKIMAFDIATNTDYELLDLNNIPAISIRENTQITKQYFINSSKKFAIQLVENLGSDKYKTSFIVFDPKNYQVKEIVSTTGGSGDPANWYGFSISPDEKHLFMLYINPYDVDPFSDVPNVVTNNQSYFDNTYFFYDLTSDSLKKFKTDQRLTQTVGYQWSEDSQSVLIRYSQSFDPQNRLVFFKVFPSGQTSVILSEPIDRELRKSQYFDQLKKIFYIATGSTKEEKTFHQELFGFIDLNNNSFNDINDPEIHSLDFVYDYSGGIIFDAFYREGGIVKERVLNRYDIATGKITQITSSNVFIIGFNGDYSHLLARMFRGPKQDLYDLNIKNGELVYLNTLPSVPSSISVISPKSIEGLLKPNPLYPKVFSVKIYIAEQVNPEYATPQNILSIINSQFKSDGINKSFQGEIIVFDQNNPTTCKRYPNPAIYAPDEFCSTTLNVDLALAIFHDYPGGGAFTRHVEVGDRVIASGPDYGILFHEIGHTLTSSVHYDDVWSAQQTSICNCSYQSPYITDFMGGGYSSKYLEHTVGLINRTKDIVETDIPHQVLSETYYDIPIQISLKLSNGEIASGQLTIYYPDLTNTVGNGHTPMVLSEEKHFPTFTINGYLSYPDLNRKYTEVSPWWLPYNSYPRILFLGLLKLENGGRTYFGWLDSAVLQTQFFKGETPTITLAEQL